MALIDFRGELRKKVIEKFIAVIDGQYSGANEIANEFYNLALNDPILAIEQLPSFIAKTRNVVPDRAFVEAVAGGPNYDFTGPMLNIIGIIYPNLDIEARTKALTKCIGFLDELNYFNAQNNVEFIDEPWFVGDIIINRSLYWCGYRVYCDLLQQNKEWKDFSPHIPKARSEFWLSLAVIQPNYSSLEIRTRFYRRFPELIDRTQDAVAAITFDHARRANERGETLIEDYIDEHILKYDTMLHDNIKRKIEERKWVRLD